MLWTLHSCHHKIPCPQINFELKKPCDSNVKSGLVGKSKPTKLTSLVNLLFLHRFDVVEWQIPISEAAHFWSIGKCMKFLSEVMRMLIVVMTLFYLWLYQPHKKPSINTHWTVHKSCTCYCWPASPAKIVLIICVNHIVYILYPSKGANEKRERKKNTTTKPIQPVWQESVLEHCWNASLWSFIRQLWVHSRAVSSCVLQLISESIAERTDYQREVVGFDGLTWSREVCLSSPTRF